MNPRRSFVGFLAVACVFAISAGLQHVGRNSTRPGAAVAQTPAVPDTIKVEWTLPQQRLLSASFSPDNAFLAVVDDRGAVTLRHRNGTSKPVWSLPNVNATTAVVGPGGHTVIAFSALDPMRRSVTIITATNKKPVPTQYALDGAVWDATISADGKYAAIVTGGHSLYLIALTGAPRCQRRDLMGTGNSVAINRDGSLVASGTWDESGVVCYNSAGEVWHYQDQPNRLFEAQIAHDSPFVLGVSYANVQQSNAKLYLWTTDGKPLFAPVELGPDDSDPKAMIAADGTRIAVAYLHKITHGDQYFPVRELEMLDQTGHVRWLKGGALMSPNLVAISRDGSTVTVTDGQRALYNFDAVGKISTSYRLSALIDRTFTSNDGAYVLVHTEDDNLTLIRPA